MSIQLELVHTVLTGLSSLYPQWFTAEVEVGVVTGPAKAVRGDTA